MPQALAVDQGHRKDRTGLDADVEQIGAIAEPVLGDQQVAGTGYRQDFGNAFDDAVQNDVDQGLHGDRYTGWLTSRARIQDRSGTSPRPEEGRVGKEGYSTCRSWG